MYHNGDIQYGSIARDAYRRGTHAGDTPMRGTRAARLRSRRARTHRMVAAFLASTLLVVGVVAAVRVLGGSSSNAEPASSRSPAVAAQQSAVALPPAPPCKTYVAPGGSDAATGSIAQPLRSITHAAALAVPDNVVCLRGGTYHEVVQILRSGVTLQSMPGEDAVIDGTGVALKPTDGLLQIAAGTDGVTVRDLTIQDSIGRGVTNGGSHNRVLGTKIVNTQNAGLLTTNLNGPATDNEYVGNDISRTVQSNDCHTLSDPCRRTGGWESAVNAYEAGSAPVGRNLYAHNHIYDNDGEGITPVDGDIVRANTLNDNYATEVYVDRQRNVLVDGNFLYESETRYLPITANQSYRLLARGIGIADESRPTRSAGTIIRNNIIVNTREGIYFWNATPGSGLIDSTIDNNTIVNTWDNGIDFDPSTATKNNVLRDNIIVPRQGGLTKGVDGVPGIQATANLFVDRGARDDPRLAGEGTFSFDPGDYMLTKASRSAIDKGVPSSARADYFGSPRPDGAGFDIGADEFR